MANEQKILQPLASSLQPYARMGLFGGTFDPIHLGHLILAETAFEQLSLDRLIFIPAKISAYKKEQPPMASAADRLKMIELAIVGKEGWSVDDRELLRAGVSFTIDTVREFREEFPQATFFCFIGEDQLAGLDGWKESQELFRMVSFVVLRRGEPRLINSQSDKFFQGSQPPSLLQEDRRIDISSTEIRNRIAQEASVDYLLPSQIAIYLNERKLYQMKIEANDENLSPKSVA